MSFRTYPDREQEMIFYSKVCGGSADFKFLGVHISEDLSWSLNTAHIIRKAQQRLFFLISPNRNKLPAVLLKLTTAP